MPQPIGTARSTDVRGHSKNDEVDLYTQAADQERLARGANEQLSEWEDAPIEDHMDLMAAAAAKALKASENRPYA